MKKNPVIKSRSTVLAVVVLGVYLFITGCSGVRLPATVSATDWEPLANRAAGMLQQGDFKQVQPLYRQILASASGVGADAVPGLLQLAEFYRAAGKCQQAETLAQCALKIREVAAMETSGPGAQMDLAISLNVLAQVYLTSKKYDQAMLLLNRSLNIIEQITGSESVDAAQPLAMRARILRAQGKYQPAIEQYARALAAAESLGADTPEQAVILNEYIGLLKERGLAQKAQALLQGDYWRKFTQLASRAYGLRDYNQAEMYCQQAVLFAQTFGPTDARWSRTQTQLAEIYCQQGKPDLAEQTLEQTITNCEAVAGMNSTNLLIPFDALANVYDFEHKILQKALLRQRSLTLIENSAGHDDAEIARRSRDLGSLYQAMGDYDKAEPFFQEAVVRSEKANDDVAAYLLAAADFYRAARKCDQAESMVRRALAIREKSAEQSASPNEQLDVIQALDVLGRVCQGCNQFSEAESAYSRSLKLIEKMSSPESTDLIPCLCSLAEIQRTLGNSQQAETQLQRALTIAEKGMGVNAPEVADILEKQAGLLKDMNRPAEATALLTRVESIHKGAPPP